VTFAIAYPVATAGAGAASLAAGIRTLRAQVPPAALMAVAAGCLGAILTVDLVPDVRAGAGKAHLPSAYLMAAATVVLCGLALGHLARTGRVKPGDFGTSVGLPFTAHGLVEGVAVGAVVGWHSAVTPGLLLALVIHKAAEGADLGACLAGSGSSVTTDRRGLRWLADQRGTVVGPRARVRRIGA
jgi:zinc transporter ZupT